MAIPILSVLSMIIRVLQGQSLSSCNRDPLTCKASTLNICPYTEKIYNHCYKLFCKFYSLSLKIWSCFHVWCEVKIEVPFFLCGYLFAVA